MRIAVISDSHDHLHQIAAALEKIRAENCDRILHCGDFVAPFALRTICEAGIPVDAVFGNNDGDRFKLAKLMTRYPHLKLHGETGVLATGGIRIAFSHYFPAAEGLAATGRYDLVCFGHSHKWYEATIGHTRLLNPGEIMGKTGRAGFAIVETTPLSIREILI